MPRTVLITGATRGLGRSIAVAFAKSGYQVALNYAHNEDNAREALAEVRDHLMELKGNMEKTAAGSAPAGVTLQWQPLVPRPALSVTC